MTLWLAFSGRLKRTVSLRGTKETDGHEEGPAFGALSPPGWRANNRAAFGRRFLKRSAANVNHPAVIGLIRNFKAEKHGGGPTRYWRSAVALRGVDREHAPGGRAVLRSRILTPHQARCRCNARHTRAQHRLSANVKPNARDSRVRLRLGAFAEMSWIFEEKHGFAKKLLFLKGTLEKANFPPDIRRDWLSDKGGAAFVVPISRGSRSRNV
jgi:hypothetical protein